MVVWIIFITFVVGQPGKGFRTAGSAAEASDVNEMLNIYFYFVISKNIITLVNVTIKQTKL